MHEKVCPNMQVLVFSFEISIWKGDEVRCDFEALILGHTINSLFSVGAGEAQQARVALRQVCYSHWWRDNGKQMRSFRDNKRVRLGRRLSVRLSVRGDKGNVPSPLPCCPCPLIAPLLSNPSPASSV